MKIFSVVGPVLVAAIVIIPYCVHPAPKAHVGERAWVDEAGELVVAPGYVLSTDGDCAALAPGSTLPPIAFEDAQHCFHPVPTSTPNQAVLRRLDEISPSGSLFEKTMQFQNGPEVRFSYDLECRCHPGTEACPPTPPVPCVPVWRTPSR